MLLSHIGMVKPTLILIVTLTCCLTAAGQTPSSETRVVKGDANACELNSAYLDYMVRDQRANSERIFVISRLGRGESKRSLSRGRLQYARFYLLESGRTQKEKVIFAEGDRVDGEGRVEFYLGSRLYLVSLAERGRNVCLTCCEDYVPPRKSRKQRRR
jgi:hypothetical protein